MKSRSIDSFTQSSKQQEHRHQYIRFFDKMQSWVADIPDQDHDYLPKDPEHALPLSVLHVLGRFDAIELVTHRIMPNYGVSADAQPLLESLEWQGTQPQAKMNATA